MIVLWVKTYTAEAALDEAEDKLSRSTENLMASVCKFGHAAVAEHESAVALHKVRVRVIGKESSTALMF